MRLAGRERLGFYPFRFQRRSDPQIPTISGELFGGLTLASGGWRVREVTGEAKVTRYGIEAGCTAAALARSSADEVIHGDCFDVQCPVNPFH